MMKRYIITEAIRKDVKASKFLRAILQASADLEHLSFSKLLFEKGIKGDLMKNWTLGKYIEWISKLELIDGKYSSLLRDFNRIRNMVVHGRYIIGRIEKDPQKSKLLKEVILAVCDFIDATYVEYKPNQKIEDEYSEFFKKINEKHEKLLNELKSGAE